MSNHKEIEEALSNGVPGSKVHEWLRQLLDENQALQKQLNNTKDAWKEQAEQIRSLRAALEAVNYHNKGQHYTWIPYEENHLETLSCPVLIPAEWIRQLIDEAKRETAEAQAKEIERLNETIKILTKLKDAVKEQRDKALSHIKGGGIITKPGVSGVGKAVPEPTREQIERLPVD